MNKRGQVTIFVIIGIVLIILILLLLFLRSKVYISPLVQQNPEELFPSIRKHIEDCLVEISTPRLYQIARQGGFLDTPEGTFRLEKGEKISYLCWNIKDQKYCRSRILRLQDMENELNEFILKDLQTQCLNINSFQRGRFDINQGQLKIKTTMSDDSVLVEANLPIKVTIGELVAEQSDFSALINVPLGRLFESSRDIVNAEATIGDFDTVPYSLLKTQLTSKPYIIQRKQPYPDKLYIMKIKDTPSEDNEYIFQFFIQDEPR